MRVERRSGESLDLKLSSTLPNSAQALELKSTFDEDLSFLNANLALSLSPPSETLTQAVLNVCHIIMSTLLSFQVRSKAGLIFTRLSYNATHNTAAPKSSTSMPHTVHAYLPT